MKVVSRIRGRFEFVFTIKIRIIEYVSMSCWCLACLPLPHSLQSLVLASPDFNVCTRHEALAFPAPDRNQLWQKITQNSPSPSTHLFPWPFSYFALPHLLYLPIPLYPSPIFQCVLVGHWGNIANGCWNIGMLLDFPLHRDHCGSNHPITDYLSVINPQRQRSDDPTFPPIYDVLPSDLK